MKYPSRSEYYSAIRNPQFAFRKKDPHSQSERDLDSSLVKGKAVQRRKGNGITDIWSASGSFAIAFKYETVFPNKTWAIRCFYRSNFNVIRHYRTVLKHLKHTPVRDYFVDFTLLEQGIRVQGTCYPVLKMEWIEGKNLKKFIKANLNRKNLLKSLAESWLTLSNRLLEAKVAHGDLQHGNVIVIDRFDQLSLKLIDYDSLYFVKDFQPVEDNIKGLSDYQHPLRKSLDTRCLEIDFFPQLVIYLSILALAEDKKLWHMYRLEDREGLLFSKADFENPDRSPIFQSLAALPSPIPALANKLQQICQLHEFKQIPSLDRAINEEASATSQAIESSEKTKISLGQFFEPVVSAWQESCSLVQDGFRQLGKIKLIPDWRFEPGFYKELSDVPLETEDSSNTVILSEIELPEKEKTPNFFQKWGNSIHLWWQEKIVVQLAQIKLDALLPPQKNSLDKEESPPQKLTFKFPSLPIKAQILPADSNTIVQWNPRSSKNSQIKEDRDRPKNNRLKELAVTIQTSIDNQTNLLRRQLRKTKRLLLITRLRTQKNFSRAFNAVGSGVRSNYQKFNNQLSQTSVSLNSRWQNTLEKTKKTLKSQTAPKTWTTREVATQLDRSVSWCHRQRYQYPDEFTSGIHYYKDDREIIQWTRAGIRQLLRIRQSKSQPKPKPTSQSNIPTNSLPTKVVSANLGTSSQWITRTRANYPSRFIEGIHYHIDAKKKHYVWTPEGVEQLQQIFALIHPSKSSRRKSKTVARN